MMLGLQYFHERMSEASANTGPSVARSPEEQAFFYPDNGQYIEISLLSSGAPFSWRSD
jgi:hypothetical protein